MTTTKNYWDSIKRAKALLSDADAVLIGVGAGLSASGGLNYMDPKLAQKWFPYYYKKGYETLVDIQGNYWWFHNSKPELYWGYWGKHIYHLRYEAPLLEPYKDLATLIDDKNYFVISTNVDGQLEKAGIPKDKIFAPQGDYAYFQCSKPCSKDIYYNEKMIKRMISNMPNEIEISTEDIPKCPRCNSPLIPNLRADHTFVEEPHLKNLKSYESFVENNKKKQLALLELGVGFNTPVIIRYPFEHMVASQLKTNLIRINLTQSDIPEKIKDKSIGFKVDIGKTIKDLIVK